jgi:hypothetical protein
MYFEGNGVPLDHAEALKNFLPAHYTNPQRWFVRMFPWPLPLISGPNFERLVPNATHGDRHLLLALEMTIERLTAFAKVIERCGHRVAFRYRPVNSVCF